MKYFYLSRWIHLVVFFVLTFFWMVGLPLLLLLVFFAYCLFLFIFRKKRGVFKENPSITDGVLYSPVQGKVIQITPNSSHPSIGEGLTEIVVKIPWHVEYGVYLPFTSEVKDLFVVKGRDFFRLSKLKDIKFSDRAGVMLALENQKGDEIGLQLIKCTAGLWPEIKVMPGDRGKRQANIGLLPFGGTLVLYIPSKYEILVQDGQDVIAGESLIAGQH